MQVRVLTTILLFALLSAFVAGQVLEPTSYQEVTEMLEDNKHNIVTLIFVDPEVLNAKLGPEGVILNEESKGFFGGIIGSVASLFTQKERTMSDMIYDISLDNLVIQINSTNDEFTKLEDMYNIITSPFVIILKGNKILYRETASRSSEEKIMAVIKAYNYDLLEKEKESKAISEEMPLTNKVVNIAQGKDSLKASSQDEPYYFGNNTLTESSDQIQDASSVSITQFPVYPAAAFGLGPVVNPLLLDVSSNRSQPNNGRFVTPYMAPVRRDVPNYVLRGNSTRYVSSPFGYKATDDQFEKVDGVWKDILKDEERMVSEIKKIHDEDAKLSDTLKTSEGEIHESEESFYKAKNAIDKSLKESEQQLLQYERELDTLYNARKSAMRAREDLYHGYPNAYPTREGYIEQRMNGPYRTISRPGGPAPSNYNFHKFYNDVNSANATYGSA